MIYDKFKSWFVQFRRGKAFLQTLAAFLVCYLIGRVIFHYDESLGVLNLMLSIEASVATCMLLDMGVKQYESDKVIVEHIEEEVEEIHEKVIGE